MRIRFQLIFPVAAFLGALGLGAASAGEDSAGDVGVVRHALENLVPGLEPDTIRPSPLAGLYEVMYGPRIYYVSSDGRYLIQGDLVDLETRENLTEASSSKARLKSLGEVGEDKMVVFAPEPPGHIKHVITVFTDIDCGYCRKLHSQMAEYNKEGIEIRYLLFPRAGIGSPSYEKAVSVWCSDDRRAALTEAKQGKPIENKKCEDPVAQHMHLGELMGVTGTPALILESGELLPGYVPPARLAAFLDDKKGAN